MEIIKSFSVDSPTKTLVVGTSSTNVIAGLIGQGNRSIRLVNAGNQVVFIQFGNDSSVAATIATGFAMLANSVETFFWRNQYQYIAAIAASAGSTLYCTVGEGN